MRTVLTQGLDTRPLRQVATMRAQPANAKKRLDICKIWGEQLESGEIDVEKIFFTDEKLFRLGSRSGGHRNFVAYVRNGVEKPDAPNDIIPRGEGKWHGGVIVMVALCLSFRGKGTLHFVPMGGTCEFGSLSEDGEGRVRTRLSRALRNTDGVLVSEGWCKCPYIKHGTVVLRGEAPQLLGQEILAGLLSRSECARLLPMGVFAEGSREEEPELSR